jgi:hypothetical protein
MVVGGSRVWGSGSACTEHGISSKRRRAEKGGAEKNLPAGPAAQPAPLCHSCGVSAGRVQLSSTTASCFSADPVLASPLLRKLLHSILGSILWAATLLPLPLRPPVAAARSALKACAATRCFPETPTMLRNPGGPRKPAWRGLWVITVGRLSGLGAVSEPGCMQQEGIAPAWLLYLTAG